MYLHNHLFNSTNYGQDDVWKITEGISNCRTFFPLRKVYIYVNVYSICIKRWIDVCDGEYYRSRCPHFRLDRQRMSYGAPSAHIISQLSGMSIYEEYSSRWNVRYMSCRTSSHHITFLNRETCWDNSTVKRCIA